MKKSLGSIIVIILSLIGANAFASKIDFAVKKATKNTSDFTGSQNGSGTMNSITKSK